MKLSFFHQHAQFTRLFTKKLNEQLASVGLYRSQWMIVYYLKNFGPSTLIQIGQYFNVEKPTITRTVERLETMALVEVVPSQDKREKRIQLTDKGIHTYHEAKKVVDDFEGKIMDGISNEEMERSVQIIQLLNEKLK